MHHKIIKWNLQQYFSFCQKWIVCDWQKTYSTITITKRTSLSATKQIKKYFNNNEVLGINNKSILEVTPREHIGKYKNKLFNFIVENYKLKNMHVDISRKLTPETSLNLFCIVFRQNIISS